MELAKDTRNCEARGVGMTMNREIRIKMAEDRGRGEMMFEFIKSFLSLPFEVLILPEEGRHGGGDMGITVNESTVEVGKAEEDQNIMNRGWSRRCPSHSTR